MVSKMLGGAARPYMETDPFSFLTFHQPLEGMRCRVLGIMARNSGLTDCSVADTSLVGLSGVHRITVWISSMLCSSFPCRYYSSHHAGEDRTGQDKRCLLGWEVRT